MSLGLLLFFLSLRGRDRERDQYVQQKLLPSSQFPKCPQQAGTQTRSPVGVAGTQLLELSSAASPRVCVGRKVKFKNGLKNPGTPIFDAVVLVFKYCLFYPLVCWEAQSHKFGCITWDTGITADCQPVRITRHFLPVCVGLRG